VRAQGIEVLEVETSVFSFVSDLSDNGTDHWYRSNYRSLRDEYVYSVFTM